MEQAGHPYPPAFALKAMFDRTRVAMIATDPNRDDNPIVFVNDAFLVLTGYDRDEVLGRNCRFLQGGKTDPATVAAIRLAIAEERSETFEVLNYRKDGTPFWNALHISPVYDERGDLAYFSASQREVTERRKAVEALEGKAKLRDEKLQTAIDRARALEFAFEQVRDSVLITEYGPLDPPGPRITWVNRGFERMTGYAAEEVIGKTPRILQGPQTDKAQLAELRARLDDGSGHARIQTVNYRKDGAPFVIEWSVSPVHDDDGEPSAWMAVQRDVTERVEAERERETLIAELDHRVRNLFSTVQVIVRGARAEDGTDEGLRRRLLYQLDALNAAQGIVYQDGARHAPIGEIVDATLEAFDPEGKLIRRRGGEGSFDAKQAINAAIIIYELGRLSSERGAVASGKQVSISWEKIGPELRITWEEEASVPEPGRFGFSLVRTFVQSSRWEEAGITEDDGRFVVKLGLRAV